MTDGALVITGPTASGKSSLALKLAEYLDIEIISADSAQVYCGMDIGTAKPDQQMLAKVPHHLIDIRAPSEPYSAADFRDDVLDIVPGVVRRGRIPVITGGTMLYLKALKEGLADMPEADPDVRREINQLADRQGWQTVHEELASYDPQSADRIKPGDTQRLQRAVEVYRVTGSTMTELHQQKSDPCPFTLVEVGIMPPDRSILHREIAHRFHEMLAAGLVAEVEKLKSDPANHAGLPAIRAVGYRQIWSYLAGDIDFDTMVEKGIVATRQLAKRQYTWMRGWQDMRVLEFPDIEEVLKIARSTTILT